RHRPTYRRCSSAGAAGSGLSVARSQSMLQFRAGSGDVAFGAIGGDVLPEKFQGAFTGQRGARRVVTPALIAVESMVGGVDVEQPLRMRGFHLRHVVR